MKKEKYYYIKDIESVNIEDNEPLIEEYKDENEFYMGLNDNIVWEMDGEYPDSYIEKRIIKLTNHFKSHKNVAKRVNCAYLVKTTDKTLKQMGFGSWLE